MKQIKIDKTEYEKVKYSFEVATPHYTKEVFVQIQAKASILDPDTRKIKIIQLEPINIKQKAI